MKKIAIIGGGAAGMTAAIMLARKGCSVALLERGERLGRKLSSTGNGQGNVTNANMGAEHYFSDDNQKVARALARFDWKDAVSFLEGMGGIFLPDSRGRVYPAGRQASAVTDLLRGEISRLGAEVCFGAQVKKVAYDGKSFRVEWAEGHMAADAVVLAAGGCAAPSFGTDGNAYALAKAFSHSVSELSPALVQLKTDPAAVRGLKGIRVDSLVTLKRQGREIFRVRGDVLFTEGGVSGDAVFRASSYAKKGDVLQLDFLPDLPYERLKSAYSRGGLLCVVNNALARALEKKGDALALVKCFPLTVTGSYGFAGAQVTKGGIPLKETDENLMSRFQKGLYFAGEILNVDGECGGYNLQWAFTSAHCVTEGICS